MCDIIECKKCHTVNYLDPYYFWNWKGKIACAECGTVYYIHMVQGFMYQGPEEKTGEKPDILPLYADKPLEGYKVYEPGTPNRTRPFECLPRDIYLGKADKVRFSIRGKPVRGWSPQPARSTIGGSFGYKWDIEHDAPDVWKEYQEKLKKGEVREW